MRPQNAILRASVEKDEDPAVSMGGALYGPVGKTGSSLERGGRLQEEQEARRVSKWSLEGVQPRAHLSTQKTGSCCPEVLEPGPKLEPTDASWEWLALSSTVNRSQSSTEGQFVANQLT